VWSVAVMALALAACSAPEPSSERRSTSAGSTDADTPPGGPTAEPGGPSVVPSAAPSGTGACVPVADLPGGQVASGPATDDPFPWDRPDPVVAEGFDAGEIVSGGPPPDGIMPIDQPCFDDVSTAGKWLEPTSPVMVLEVDGDTRAYPLAIMTQHEIVNDVVAGVPVVVTYCPLCNSGLAFDRTVAGIVLDFGTSGRLFQSNLVMYDRQTRTLWSQFTGDAVVGAGYVGTTLERVPTSLLGWEDVVANVPDARVLSRSSVPGRDYGRNPYPGYEGNGDGFLFRGPRDDRVGPNTRVVGLGTDRDPVAVTLPHLQDEQVVEVEVDGAPVTVWWAPGQSSALDAATVDDGVDVGSTAAFDPRLDDGTMLSFEPIGDGTFTDTATGSTFTLLGDAVDGELAGTRLKSIARDDTFWFVWFAFQPTTTVVPDPTG